MIVFPDSYSNDLIKSFTPDYSPYEIFSQGAFYDHYSSDYKMAGYWRPIYSQVLGKEIKDDYKKYDWSDLPIDKLLTDKPDVRKNKYGVGAGQSLRTWECNGWIDSENPRGWLDWYCSFYAGRRIPAIDSKQIKRWISMKRRFGRVKDKSPAIKQTLLNWAIDWEICN